MPHEAIGEIVGGIIEIGAESIGNSDNKKSGIGCFFILVIILLLVIGGYFLIYSNPSTTKGIITKKLPQNKMVVKTKDGEDVYTITPDLYLNKEEGDSIILK